MLKYFLCLTATLLSAHFVVADEAVKEAPKPPAKEAEPVKTRDVKLKDLTLKLPVSWKESPSASRMRLGTYSVPPAKDDDEHGELTVFSFGGGGGDVTANIDRWVGQFSGEGRTSKVTKGKAGDNDYYIADIAGTYQKPDGPPILRKTVAAPDYRMLGVILVLKDKGVYYLKLTGPDETIKAAAKDFRTSFGGKAKTETKFGE